MERTDYFPAQDHTRWGGQELWDPGGPSGGTPKRNSRSGQGYPYPSRETGARRGPDRQGAQKQSKTRNAHSREAANGSSVTCAEWTAQRAVATTVSICADASIKSMIKLRR